jgi:hypothetical protein
MLVGQHLARRCNTSKFDIWVFFFFGFVPGLGEGYNQRGIREADPSSITPLPGIFMFRHRPCAVMIRDHR